MHQDNVAGWFDVPELCTRPADDDAILALLAAVGEQAARQDCPMGWGRLFVPREPRVEAAAGHLLHDPQWSDFTTVLARPLSAALDTTRLEALFQAPGAICWSQDLLSTAAGKQPS